MALVSAERRVTRYPIYIISKGRWESRLTSKAFESMRVPYRIVIEPQEYEQYSAVIDTGKILVLPFSNLNQGSIPARNWVWEHSIGEGHQRHWIIDDNIKNFGKFHGTKRRRINDPTTFCEAEHFVDRYENVALAGFDYSQFVKQGSLTKVWDQPFKLNTRIYSCILIKNDIPFRWRGIYNEDTDLSLRVLKAGYCTVLFEVYIVWKQPTMTMKGGNTDELYKADGRLKMAQSLQQQHPDVTKITHKWGRWQHHVDYRPFKVNRLRLKDA